MLYMAKHGCLLAFTLALASCGQPAPSSPEAWVFPGTAAVKLRGSGNRFLMLLETLQPQLNVTSPLRTASLVNASGEIASSFAAPEGWILVDAVAHPSGDVSV